jgi:hypothetical protein
MLKKAVSEAAADGSTGGVAPGYVEDAFEARTTLADFFSILLDVFVQIDAQKHPKETEEVDFYLEA